ncbi:hypothetical protein M9Y10_019829 [Tritrichomonas musculus]|uniref:Surface antigen BspA-like protein n=1 Tax=Tritrichomonas musculus TaxID=1915356 RepID=A0ABR2GKJ0_9EUKA
MSENDDKTRKSEEVLSSILSFHNYEYFPSFFDDRDEFYYLCSNNYHKLVNLFIEKKKEYIEKMKSEGISFQEAANENKVEIIYYLLLTYNCVPEKCLRNNQEIRKIAIPSSVTSIGNYAFSRCSSLEQITIPPSVTSIGDYTFYDCSSLTQITVPPSVTSIGEYAFPYETTIIRL